MRTEQAGKKQQEGDGNQKGVYANGAEERLELR